MRSSPALSLFPALIGLILLSGCGYVHFGRYAPPANSTELSTENSDLRTENKVLRQEIALAQKEKDALRATIEARGQGADDSSLAVQLAATTKELGTLRASYARLQSELSRQRSTPAGGAGNLAAAEQIANLKTQLGVYEDRLSQAQADTVRLQQENRQLRADADRMRQENSLLAQQVASLTTEREQSVASLTQMNTELLAEREARQQAEEGARNAQNQLKLALAAPAPAATPAPTTLSDARATTAASARQLDPSLHIDAQGAATAEFRTSPERLAAPAASAGRLHVVAEGDTLESIALHYYGNAERWRVIYAANNTLLRGGQKLKPGMQLEIPEN